MTAMTGQDDDQDEDVTLHDYRSKRFAAFLLKGLFGTFMGLYNRHQFKEFKKEFNTVVQRQNRLLVVTALHSQHIANLQTDFSYMREFASALSLATPVLVLVRLREIELHIENDLNRISDAITQAQLHRLSPLLLNATQLQHLFSSLQSKASRMGTQLLLEQPSDLFQIETSFAFDGTDVTLVVHVPMVDQRALLHLYRFLPFPLSFSDTHSLTPRPRKALFAISSNEPRLSLELSEADLEGCYRVNSVYLCERLGVLSRRLDQTCMGALYDQKFKLALGLCNMDVTPATERVVQLNKNWFLIYSIKAFTALMSCRNGTSGEFHLKVGVNRIPLSASCRLSLQDHILFADTALQVNSRIQEVQWELEDDDFSLKEFAETQEILDSAEEAGALSPTLADVRAQSAQSTLAIGCSFCYVA